MGFRPLSLHPERDPWERQPDESPKAFGRFAHYRDTPPSSRSYQKVAESYGCSLATIQKQAAAHRWQDRADAFDANETAIRRAHMRERDAELCKAQMDIARAASAIAIRSVRTIADTEASLDPAVLPKWVEMIERLRRIALDQPDQVIEVTGHDRGPVQVEAFADLTEDQKRDKYNEIAAGWLRLVEGGKAS